MTMQSVMSMVNDEQAAVHKSAAVEKTDTFFIVVVAVSVAAALLQHPVAGFFCIASYGVVVALIRISRRLRQQKDSYSTERELPLIAEKLLMAVRSGYDLVPALTLVGTLAEDQHSLAKKFIQFALRCEQGERLESVLRTEAQAAPSIAFKHMCLHLAVAHKEGGELTKPLEELSDATQNFVEESENEAIAKLPVKATLPLVIIFVGLITCFVTPPLVQIVHALKEATVR